MHKVFFSQLLLRRKLVVFPEVMLVFLVVEKTSNAKLK